MEAQTLRPQRKEICIKGKMSYSEGIQAWNVIRFKKELINEFPQLREKISKFFYKLVFYQEYDDLEKSLRKLRRNKEAIPILMWLVKEKTL